MKKWWWWKYVNFTKNPSHLSSSLRAIIVVVRWHPHSLEWIGSERDFYSVRYLKISENIKQQSNHHPVSITPKKSNSGLWNAYIAIILPFRLLPSTELWITFFCARFDFVVNCYFAVNINFDLFGERRHQ